MPWSANPTNMEKPAGRDVLLAVDVECYAGYRGEQTPRALLFAGRRVDVSAVLDAWLAPDHRYFKLRDPAGDTYIVRHDVATDVWEMTFYRRAISPESP